MTATFENLTVDGRSISIEEQVSDAIALISNHPNQRLTILSDLYRILLDRLNAIFVTNVGLCEYRRIV